MIIYLTGITISDILLIWVGQNYPLLNVSDAVIFGHHAIRRKNLVYAPTVKARIGIHPRK
jgi:hypothetical protein